MIVGKDQLPDTNEGYLFLPRRIGWAIIVGGVLYAAGTGWAANGYVARLEKLESADARFYQERVERRTVVDQRLTRLEQNQDRITRLEEQVKISIEMLKEIKDELKRR
jgi:uncharacterized protein YdcH (DUF465 family)